MGKKKKKKKKDNYSSNLNSGIYNSQRNQQIADQLEEYLDLFDSLFIIEGQHVDVYKSAKKEVRKAIKNLREGHPEKVFNLDEYEDYIDSLEEGYSSL